MGRNYPYVTPSIKLKQVKGIDKKEQANLINLIKDRSVSLAESGSVMVCELVQIAEEFLLAHNKDPTLVKLSAWEQMKVREEQEKKVALEGQEKLDSFMRLSDESEARLSDESETRSPHRRSYVDDSQNTFKGIDEINDDTLANEKVKKEFARKMEALDQAEQGRRKLRNTEMGLGKDDEDEIFDLNDELANDDDADDFDFDETIDRNDGMISRYRSDFIESDLLGKGGGGEVVKVRNRLDRRICEFNHTYPVCLYRPPFTYFPL